MRDLIDRKALIAEYDRVHIGPPGGARKLMEAAPTVDAVEVEKYNELKHDNDVLKRLINGEWVDTDDVQKALGIDFSTGMRMFELSRTAKWNPAPLNGQYIETKFRLKGRSDE